MKMIVTLLKVAMLGQAGLAIQLSTSQRDCENEQQPVCTFWKGLDFTGDSYSLCSLEVSRNLGVAFDVASTFQIDDIAFQSWKCFDRSKQYYFCPVLEPNMLDWVSRMQCMSAGGEAENPKILPLAQISWILVADNEQVPIYEDANEYMQPMTMYSGFGCQSASSVFFQGDPNKKDYTGYQYNLYGAKSVAVPIGYHAIFYDKVNYGYNEPDYSKVIKVLIQDNFDDRGPQSQPGDFSVCQELDDFSYQSHSFCLCKNNENDNNLHGPEHCYCPGCENCTKWPMSPGCNPVCNPDDYDTPEGWTDCVCSLPDVIDQIEASGNGYPDFELICCDTDTPFDDRIRDYANCQPICEEFPGDPRCPVVSNFDCTDVRFPTAGDEDIPEGR